MRAFHRIIGVVVALQIILWVITGLLFHVKYRYDEALEELKARPASVDAAAGWANPSEAIAAAGADPRDVKLVHDHRGPHYVIKAGEDQYVVISAITGEPLPEIDALEADRALRSALTASKHASRYGAVQSAEKASAFSTVLGAETPAWKLHLDTGHEITVNAITTEIAHTSLLTKWIGWTYDIHYMKYTPWNAVNIVVVLVFCALVLMLAGSGLRMFFARTRKHGYESRGIHF